MLKIPSVAWHSCHCLLLSLSAVLAWTHPKLRSLASFSLFPCVPAWLSARPKHSSLASSPSFPTRRPGCLLVLSLSLILVPTVRECLPGSRFVLTGFPCLLFLFVQMPSWLAAHPKPIRGVLFFYSSHAQLQMSSGGGPWPNRPLSLLGSLGVLLAALMLLVSLSNGVPCLCRWKLFSRFLRRGNSGECRWPL